MGRTLYRNTPQRGTSSQKVDTNMDQASRKYTGEETLIPTTHQVDACSWKFDWGGKLIVNSKVDWQAHETLPNGHNISEVDWEVMMLASTI